MPIGHGGDIQLMTRFRVIKPPIMSLLGFRLTYEHSLYTIKSTFKYILNGSDMENLLTSLTASLTELREPNKVIARAGNQPVAILNRNEAIGYFVPKSAVVDIQLESAPKDQVTAFIKTKLTKIDHVIDYLKDK